MKLYAVIDVKAKSVVSIFTSLNDETAKRSFLMLLTGAESIFTEFPEDFSVYSIADVLVDGLSVVLYEPGTEHLRQVGFTGKSITITVPLAAGSDYDKRYLRMVRQDRATLDKVVSDEDEESEVDEK